MKTIRLTLFIALICQGCSLSISGGLSTEAYYPDIRTKDGGGFGDPATSRHEVTRPSTSHVRNNDGASGNKVDDALRKFFNTK